MKLISKNIEKKSKHLKVHSFKIIDSTNLFAKKLADSGSCEGTTVVATEQTAGKGRLGRTFVSKRGGVYFSIVLRPKKSIENTLFITVAAAVATARAIEELSGKKCDIKWVNDIYIDGKKVCGILTEGALNRDGTLKYAVLGIGINIFMPKGDFPKNLPLADSIFGKKSKILFKNRLKEQFVAKIANIFFDFYNNLEQKEFIKEYQQRSFLTGKEISFTKDGKTYNAKVVGIDENANLVVNLDGKESVLSHGEIQIIGMEQLPL